MSRMRKRMYLGVASVWNNRKGVDIFIRLAEKLDENEILVLVGTNDEFDRNLDSELKSKIISIHRTADQNELAEIYSTADVFINSTREDNFPTVNIEAMACGTPVITSDVGGAAEMIDDSCGKKLPVKKMEDVENLLREIRNMVIDDAKDVVTGQCQQKSLQYNQNDRFENYLRLYEEMADSVTGLK